MAHGVGGSNRDHLANYKPPDGGWGWVVVFASFVIHFIMDGIIYSLGTYLTAFTDNFHVSHGEASLVHSLLPAVTLSTGPIASWFTNTYGCRKTTLIGSAIASLGFFLSFFVKSFYLLYITIGCIVGFGFGLVYVPAIVSVGYYFEKKRSLAIGIAVCGAGVGTFILSPLNRVLEQSYGLQGAFLVKSAIVLNMFVCGCLIRPVPVEPSEIKRAMMRKHQDRILHSRSQSQSHSAHHQFHLDPVSVDCCSENAASETPVKNSIIAITITDPLSVSKAAKMHDSMPALHLKNKNSSSLKLNSTKSPKNNTDETNKSLLRIESDVSELVQSMPMLNMTATQKAKHDANLLKPSSKMNSALDIMAHIRSLQSIPIYNINDEEMEEEENEETLVEAEANKKKKDELQFKEKTRRFLNRVKGRLNSLVHELDLSLFRDSVFLFFALSNFLTSLGFNTPFIYIVDQATLLKIEPTKADLLLSTIGISNTVGRVILGIISDMKNINRLFLYAALLTCCGLATIVEPFLTTFYALFIYAIVFGITSGGYVSLTSVLLVDLLGLDKLTNAFGILLVFQGIATLLGPPTVGILYDIFNSYNIPFVITGILIGISGFMCFFIPCLKKTPASK